MYSVLNALSNTHAFTHRKTLLHTLLSLISKIIESLQCILKSFNYFNKFVAFHIPISKCLRNLFPWFGAISTTNKFSP